MIPELRKPEVRFEIARMKANAYSYKRIAKELKKKFGLEVHEATIKNYFNQALKGVNLGNDYKAAVFNQIKEIGELYDLTKKVLTNMLEDYEKARTEGNKKLEYLLDEKMIPKIQVLMAQLKLSKELTEGLGKQINNVTIIDRSHKVMNLLQAIGLTPEQKKKLIEYRKMTE